MASPTATTDIVGDQEAVKLKPSIIEAIDQMANEIEPLLEPEAVTEMVIQSLTRLPRWVMAIIQVYIIYTDPIHRYIPVSFKDSYTPIAAAGTHTQVCYVLYYCTYYIIVYEVIIYDAITCYVIIISRYYLFIH